MVHLVRPILYFLLIILIALMVFGPDNENFQFFVLISAILSILTLMFMVAFDNSDTDEY